MELSKAKVAQPPKLAPVQNAKSEKASVQRRIFVAARTGRGKTTQILTLPGRKFVYVFDQNALPVIAGADLDYLAFLPEHGELETKLKGFNQGSLSDRPAESKQPKMYNAWADDCDARYDAGFFNDYDWVCFDSATTLVDAMFSRQMWLNKRAADNPDQGDYRVVGATLSRIAAQFAKLPCNIYMTGHVNDYKDSLTSIVETQLYLPGSARDRVPMAFTECWTIEQAPEKREFKLKTIPGDRGLKDIRSALSIENGADITIKDFSKPEAYGIGALLTKAGFKPK
jgi:AAA domain-containing protein